MNNMIRLTAIFALVLAAGVFTAPEPGAALISNPFKISMEDEREIGADIYGQLNQRGLIEQGTPAAKKLERIGDRIVKRAGLGRFPQYTFSLVDQDQVNAFATPGGYVYLYRGLWDRMDHDEDMLAAVVAHELVHTEKRHIKKRYEDQVKAQLGLSLILGAAGASEAIYRAVGLGANLTFLKYSRDQEEESDGVGIDYLRQSGYDPYGMSRAMAMLEAMAEQQGGSPPQFLSSHPSPDNRVDRSRDIAAEVLHKELAEKASRAKKSENSE